MNQPAPLHFNVLSSALFKVTSSLRTLAGNNQVLPILSNFLFEITKDTLTITASDLHSSVVATLPIEASAPCKVVVPATLLNDTLNNLPEQPLTIEINDESYGITLMTRNGKYRIACENPADFPVIPSAEPAQGFDIPLTAFKKALQKAAFAASKQEMQMSINGVNLQMHADRMVFAATDGFRLVRYTIHQKIATDHLNVTFPNRVVQLLIQLLPDESSQGRFLIEENKVHCWVGTLHIITTMVNESYPDYESIIPKEYAHELTLATQPLKQALKLIDCYTNRASHEVRLSLDKNNIEIVAEDLDFANKGETNLSCDYQGTPMKIGLNAKLFFEMVKNIAGEKIVLHLNDPTKPIVIVPQDQPLGEDLLMLTMPILLRPTNDASTR